MTIPTFQAARTICLLSKWKISNLPLQKLLYLSHMLYLGKFGEPLIDGIFQAWDLGPVEPNLYHKLKAYGGHPIVDIFPSELLPEDTDEYKSIQYVYNLLQNAPAGKLVAITHNDEGAWAKNYRPSIHNVEISNDDILNEYQKRRAK